MFKIPKQKMLSRKIGGLREITARLSFYIGILNLALTGTLNYYLVTKNIFPIDFTMFVTVILTLLALATIIDYIWIYPAHIAFTTSQAYIHNNPMARDLKLIKERLGIEEDNNEKK